MRIIEVEQGSEAWETWRARPTASCFDRFITPAKGDYSAQATRYACEIVAKRMALTRVEMMPTKWMDFGTDNEPNAAHAYEKQFGVTTTKVGFVLPDHTDAFGGSPDRLVNVTSVDNGHARAEGVVEFKCVAPETLMQMHLDPTKAELYSKPQVQGLLLITECVWADFFVWHPDLEPYHVRVLPDEAYQAKIAQHLLRFLGEIAQVEKTIRRQKHDIISVGTVDRELNWET